MTTHRVNGFATISDCETFIPDSFEHAQRLSDGLTEQLFEMQASQKSKMKTCERKTTHRASDAPIDLESETQMPGSYQYARDSLEMEFSEERPQISKTNNHLRKMKLKGSRNRNDSSKKIIKSRVPQQSFVINSAPKKGIKLIKIQVLDLECDQIITDCIHDDRVLLSSQYVVKDVGDEILDQTEKIISNISKKICNYSYTNWF